MYLSLCLFAVVFIPATSEPQSGSVRQNAPIFSPFAIAGRYLFFCSSVPERSIVPPNRIALAVLERNIDADAFASSICKGE